MIRRFNSGILPIFEKPASTIYFPSLSGMKFDFAAGGFDFLNGRSACLVHANSKGLRNFAVSQEA